MGNCSLSSGTTGAASSEAPSWVVLLEQGRWHRISGDTPDLGLEPSPDGTRYLRDTDPARATSLNPIGGLKEAFRRMLGRAPRSHWHGRAGFRAITEAWNGAVLATGFGKAGSIVIFGGGHDDYFGSNVHSFDLQTRQWRRILDGYISGSPDEYGAGAVYPEAEYPDGSPVPPHTYDYVQYDPLKNDFILFKGNSELGPNVVATPIPHILSLDTLRWRRGSRHPSARLNSGGWTTWDGRRRLVWGHSGDDGDGNAFLGFCPDGDNGDGTCGWWTRGYPNKLPGAANYNCMQICPRRDVIVVAVNAHDLLYLLDPSDPDREIAPLRSTGSKPTIASYAALEYAPNLDKLIYFSAKDGGRMYSIEPPIGSSVSQLADGCWTWRSMVDSTNDLDPIADARSHSAYTVSHWHTFGRFRIATYGPIDIAILVRHIDSSVYVSRLN